MSIQSKSWFAVTALAGLTVSLIHAGSVVAQPPGRGPLGPGRGGPPNPAELFSRMDKNQDGKLSKDEVPEPLWDRLSRADADHDGAVTKDEVAKAMPGPRPDGGRPDGPPGDGPRGPQGPSRDRDRDGDRSQPRGPRDSAPEQGRGGPPRFGGGPDRGRGGLPANAQRGPAPFAPDAFFDRLDKDGDGSLSRDEFRAVAQFHRGPHAAPGRDQFPRYRGPSSDRGPAGPPWMRGHAFGPQRFWAGPPWARHGFGPHASGKFRGPAWHHHPAGRDRGPHAHARPQHPDRHGHHRGDAKSRKHKHPDSARRDKGDKDQNRDTDKDKAKGKAEDKEKAKDKSKRADEAKSEQPQSASPSDAAVTSSPAQPSPSSALPL